LNSPSTINLDSPSVVFGSSQAADATIEPEFVSRRHFQIRSQDGVYYITDLESTNGTYLNGERLPTNVERRVKDGDRIGLAVEAVVLRFIDPVGTVKIDTSTPMISGPPNPDQDKKGLVVDLASRDVWVRGQKQDPPLSRKEFDILETLYRNRGNAVNREDIGKAGWPERGDARVSDEEIDQYILRLRRRIETNPSSPTLIVTLRGFGFRMP
jgi:hypothetical protein